MGEVGHFWGKVWYTYSIGTKPYTYESTCVHHQTTSLYSPLKNKAQKKGGTANKHTHVRDLGPVKYRFVVLCASKYLPKHWIKELEKMATGNPIGRPKKKTEKNPVGRPKGEAAIMKGYRTRMLNSPQSRKVMDAIFEVAQDTEHKHWPAAMKLIADRILPVAGFEKEAGGAGARSAIQISITGVPGVNIGPAESDPVDAEYSEVEPVE